MDGDAPVFARDVAIRLQRSRQELRESCELIRLADRDRKPAPDRWSASGVVEHLARVDERYVALFAATVASAARRTSPTAAGADLPEAIEAMLADRSVRRDAPESMRPEGLEWEASWRRAETARAALLKMMTDAASVAWGEITHHHPRFGVLNIIQCGGFLASHELRHAAQIREIAVQFGAQTTP